MNKQNKRKIKIIKKEDVNLIKRITPLLSDRFDEIESNKIVKNMRDGNFDEVRKKLNEKTCSDIVASILDADKEELEKILKTVSIDIKDEWGYTPLMRAVMNDDVEKVKMLLEKGANCNVKHPIIGSAYEYAEKFNKKFLKILMVAHYERFLNVLLKNKK